MFFQAQIKGLLLKELIEWLCESKDRQPCLLLINVMQWKTGQGGDEDKDRRKEALNSQNKNIITSKQLAINGYYVFRNTRFQNAFLSKLC